MKPPNSSRSSFVPVALSVALALCGTGCSYSRLYAIPYGQAESLLLSRLKSEKAELISPPKHAAAHADGRLVRYMSMEDYSIELNAYEEGRHLRFTASNDYDIGGTGAQPVMFDLTKVDDERTKVSVDFSDRSLSLFIIPWWNPGVFRERRIAEEIFDGKNANNTK